MRKIGCLAALAALSIAQSIDARVTRFVVEERVALSRRHGVGHGGRV